MTVFHDELDLEAGKLRLKTGGGIAGHNGLRSIDAHIGPDFARVRIGIGHPGDKLLVTNHVLGDFAKSDADWLEPAGGVAEAAPLLVAGDSARFLNAVALRLAAAEAAPAQPGAEPAPESPQPGPRTPAIRCEGWWTAFGERPRGVPRPGDVLRRDGPPFTARLCALVADRLVPGTAVANRILDWPGDAAGPMPCPCGWPGRCMGWCWRRRSALAAVYPPNDPTTTRSGRRSPRPSRHMLRHPAAARQPATNQ